LDSELADCAWSRTYRSRALTFAGSAQAQVTRSGLRVLPDRVAATWPADESLTAVGTQPPAQALDLALQTIARRYGKPTERVVACSSSIRGCK
jgi:hypothetical protein